MEINNRTDLAKMFDYLGYKAGAEIGVARGNYSLILCQNIPGLHLYCVDNCMAHSGEQHWLEAQEKLKQYNVTFIKDTSVNAAGVFVDNSLDFVFIDANHKYEYVLSDLIAWCPKVRPGGIVSGHDFYNFRGSGVIEAVKEYTALHKINYTLTGTDKSSPDDQQPSFYWIKEA